MAEQRRNLLIGRGERLFEDGKWPPGRGGKPAPYSLEQQRSLFTPTLNELAARATQTPLTIAPRNEIAAKITIHPEFLAKSYFPSSLLHQSGVRLIGSRAIDITPRAMTRDKEPVRRPTAVLLIAGTAEAFGRMNSLLNSASSPNATKVDITRVEAIEPFLPIDRKRGLDLANLDSWTEVVLHASLGDEDIRNAFYDLAENAGAFLKRDRARTIGGLTFLPVKAPENGVQDFIRSVEFFTHLRAIRNMPVLAEDPNLYENDVERTQEIAPDIPPGPAVAGDFRALILDGGFSSGLLPWVKAMDAAGVPPKATNLSHGHAVTSAFLFGSIEDGQDSIAAPYCEVDHVRVLPSTATDTKVGDVIDRIISTLQAARDEGKPYTLANLSLGPRLPIVDDDPHEWTVRLDDFLSLGDLFMTVAAGNDGSAGQDLGRVQPPADAVNAFSVGASDNHHAKSKRAPYSCLGPGRSPGLVKPDVVAFGGASNKPMRLVDPLTGMLSKHAGTSYSAPLALRLAAGLMASVDEYVSPSMLHALLVSKAQFNSRNGHNQLEVGWGVLPAAVDDILYSAEDEVVVMYQGVIAKGQPIRARVPLPAGLDIEEKAVIGATFVYRAPIDPAHPVSYTRAGLEILFQPDSQVSHSFFSRTEFDTEQTLRDDALKWEACRHRQKRVPIEIMTDPSFVIRYQGRDEGASDADPVKGQDGTPLPAAEQPSALPFALVIRIRVPSEPNLAKLVLEQYSVLSEVALRVQVQNVT
ncbi:S8 family peptidase [Stenotrophomonas maltophilia]|uniref:S8 family peptidase n=1 Tax=Stenotrophomonas maltophilia TaxID=40324 RepID=UPI001FA6F2E3|nr:S8 family peptidase [Stenotrophomonas maltophilia]